MRINDNEGLAEGLNDFSASKYAYMRRRKLPGYYRFASCMGGSFPVLSAVILQYLLIIGNISFECVFLVFSDMLSKFAADS